MILDLMLSSDAKSKIINQASVPIPRHFATWFRASPSAQFDRVGKNPLPRAYCRQLGVQPLLGFIGRVGGESSYNCGTRGRIQCRKLIFDLIDRLLGQQPLLA